MECLAVIANYEAERSREAIPSGYGIWNWELGIGNWELGTGKCLPEDGEPDALL